MYNKFNICTYITIHCTMLGYIKYLFAREISRYIIHSENKPNEPLSEDIAVFAW